MKRVAAFISAHGYGHATRAAAVMEGWHGLDPGIFFEIFTQVPNFIFRESLSAPFRYHPLQTDIGLVQRSPFEEDITATAAQLDKFLPFSSGRLEGLAQGVKSLSCQLILCDIAPLGIAVAKLAGIPSVLVENFTWDWIYAGYCPKIPSLERHVAYLRQIYESATHHVQTQPVCQVSRVAVKVPPVSRCPRRSPHGIRKQLGIENGPMALITLGGIEQRCSFTGRLQQLNDWHFVIPGSADSLRREGNLVLLPHHSDFFHPDLVQAADAIIGKAGYSTVAEAYHAGVPFGYVSRPTFPEAHTMAAFVETHMAGVEIPFDAFQNGELRKYLTTLAAQPRCRPAQPNGAQAIAEFLCPLI